MKQFLLLITRAMLVISCAALALILFGSPLPENRRRDMSFIPTALLQSEHSLELVFFDDFADSRGIDLAATGNPGYSWYLDPPFDYNQQKPASVTVKDSVATIHPSGNHANWSMATTSPRTGNGQSYSYGLFLAAIRFEDHRDSQEGWPSFWALTAGSAATGAKGRAAEIDFFEAAPGPNWKQGARFNGAIHDWKPTTPSQDISFAGASSPYPITSSWHVVGALWTPGRVVWLLDGVVVGEWRHKSGATAAFNEDFAIFNEPQQLSVILGCGPGWDLDIDWVRIWKLSK